MIKENKVIYYNTFTGEFIPKEVFDKLPEFKKSEYELIKPKKHDSTIRK